MARTCTICTHPKRHEIDQLLVDCNASFRVIASRYGLTTGSLNRHKKEHLPVSMAKAKQAQEAEYGGTLLDRLAVIHKETREILQEARTEKNHALSLKAIERIEKQLELEGRLIGELQEAHTVNITLSPQWVQIRTVIIQALTDAPEARGRVIEALNAIA